MEMDGPCRNLDKGNSSSKKKGKQCVTFGCSNTFYGPNGLPSSLHFFKFPKDMNRRRRWYNLIKRQHGKDGFFVTNSTVVCLKHFRKEDIRKTLTGRWELVSGVSGHFANVSLRKLSVRKRPRSIRKRVTSQTVSSQTSSVDSQTHPSRFANVI